MKFNFSKKSSNTAKKTYLIIGIVSVILILILVMLFAVGSKKDADIENFSNNFEKNLNSSNNNTSIKPPPPPPLEYDEKKIEQMSKKADENVTAKEENISEAVNLEDLNDSICYSMCELANQPKEMNESKEDKDFKKTYKIDKNTQNIRPEDMIAYLKSNQKYFVFNGKDGDFNFEKRKYKRGDNFKGWWFVEDITPVFIRFVDKESGYAYNLRFLEQLEEGEYQ